MGFLHGRLQPLRRALCFIQLIDVTLVGLRLTAEEGILSRRLHLVLLHLQVIQLLSGTQDVMLEGFIPPGGLVHADVVHLGLLVLQGRQALLDDADLFGEIFIGSRFESGPAEFLYL